MYNKTKSATAVHVYKPGLGSENMQYVYVYIDISSNHGWIFSNINFSLKKIRHWVHCCTLHIHSKFCQLASSIAIRIGMLFQWTQGAVPSLFLINSRKWLFLDNLHYKTCLCLYIFSYKLIWLYLLNLQAKKQRN